MTDFIFLGSKITVDSDWSHEIKRCLLLGRKAMTNQDSMLKRKDITLPTKVCIVKATVFPVALYRYELAHKEGWALENWCFWIAVLEKTPESPLDSKEIKQLILKEINPEYSLEGLMLKLKLQYFDHLMQRASSREKTCWWVRLKQKEKQERQRMRWLDSITNSIWTWIWANSER